MTSRSISISCSNKEFSGTTMQELHPRTSWAISNTVWPSRDLKSTTTFNINHKRTRTTSLSDVMVEQQLGRSREPGTSSCRVLSHRFYRVNQKHNETDSSTTSWTPRIFRELSRTLMENTRRLREETTWTWVISRKQSPSSWSRIGSPIFLIIRSMSMILIPQSTADLSQTEWQTL